MSEETFLLDESIDNSLKMTPSGSNCLSWRRCKVRTLWYPRNCLSRRFITLLMIVVIVLFIYFSTLGKPSIRQLQSYMNLQSMKNPAELPNTRLTWHGGGNKVVMEDSLDDVGEDEFTPLLPYKNKQRESNSLTQILVILKKDRTNLSRNIIDMLTINRYRYHTQVIGSGEKIPSLMSGKLSKVGCIVFEDFRHYLSLEAATRRSIDTFMKDNKVGMIAFVPATSGARSTKQEQMGGYPLIVHNKLNISDVRLIANSTGFYRILKSEGDWTVDGARRPVTGLIPQHNSLMRLQEAMLVSDSTKWWNKPISTVLMDGGKIDEIRRVIFGVGLNVWLHRLLFLDAVNYCSRGKLSLPLERFLLVDVDDIFVAKKGIRMKEDDVMAMLESQSRLREMVPGFTFNLGFSGYYFRNGNDDENAGDKALIDHASQFWWFGHMWRHTQAHKLSSSEELKQSMLLNKHFAKTYNLSSSSGYSVAPHHSGVYPVHEPLYDAWKKVWGVRATSTEEYPHLRPEKLRRGFIHRGIMVLPRQLCGLFTHTLYFESEEHPNFKEKLDTSINGGELFQTIAYNYVSVMMTHMSNYGSDRLAPYIFEGVVKKLQQYTNFQLKTEPPVRLAQRYFNTYPEEREPLWGNPCLDKRHLEIWSVNKSCNTLPDFLVLGPQKTGTTALYTFLGLHSAIDHNIPSPTTFEEVQFFSSNNYFRGLDWYLKAFPSSKALGNLIFEKSATYFDSVKAPQRVKAMLPHAKLVVLLLPPEKRAYSWYQHQVSHGLSAAVQNNFSTILRADEDQFASKAMVDLRARCLGPGEYVRHLERWLEVFSSDQLFIIDSEALKRDPIAVMKELQLFLGVQPVIDYSHLIKFNVRKGFYCQLTGSGSTKCLGKSKGKKYPPMGVEDEAYLKRHFAPHNSDLADLLQKMGHSLPQWLRERGEEVVEMEEEKEGDW